ncbi:hypothetical protein ACMGT0_01180 [Pseudomonas sp. RHF3.3-3]|uniref:hypothetical protein n=1 Tax=Pseudomonas sp. RHF3.3-3 TaxID=3396624 RepID=UPI003A88BA78
MTRPLASLSSSSTIPPGMLQSEQSGKNYKANQQLQDGKNVPAQAGPNAQINFLNKQRAEMLELKAKAALLQVKNQPKKVFLSYSKKDSQFVVSDNLNFRKKLAIKLGLSDGGYSSAPFNPKFHNIANPGQRVKIEDLIERLDNSQQRVTSEIKLNETLNSGNKLDDIGEPPPAPGNLKFVKQEGSPPETSPPVKPPRNFEYSAPTQDIRAERSTTAAGLPNESSDTEVSTDREFDELYNSYTALAQMSADARDKEFDEIFGYEQTAPGSQGASLSLANPGHSEADKGAVPIRPPRKRDALNDQKKNQSPSEDRLTGIKKGHVKNLISRYEELNTDNSDKSPGTR